jgi:hypothetical protein
MQKLEPPEITKRQSKRISVRMRIQIHTKEANIILNSDTTENTNTLYPSFFINPIFI